MSPRELSSAVSNFLADLEHDEEALAAMQRAFVQASWFPGRGMEDARAGITAVVKTLQERADHAR